VPKFDAQNGGKEMATITPRTGANGVTKYKAQVRIRRKGVIVHQETETFDRRAIAVEWAKKREVELAKPGGLTAVKAEDPPLSQAITQYLTESSEGNSVRRSVRRSK
jgi:hypothetical protein